VLKHFRKKFKQELIVLQKIGEATGGNIPPQERKSCEKICDDTV
jgi:hypothetical protein